MQKYKKRIKLFASKTHIYINKNGDYIYNPKAIDVTNDYLGQLHYRTTSTPCSCYLCSGHKKYNRAKEKNNFEKNKK